MQIPKLAPFENAPESPSSLFKQLDSATMRLDKVVATLDRGQVIAHFPSGGGEFGGAGDLCNHWISDGKAKIEWSGGKARLGNWENEFGKIFFEVMRKRGFNVVGDPERLFEQVEEIQAAEYLIGARVADIRANFCQQHSVWPGGPLPQFIGETYVKVVWEVYSSLSRRVVYRHETEGYTRSVRFRRQGLTLGFQDAFSDAAERFGADRKLNRLANRKVDDGKSTASFNKLLLAGAKISRKPVKEKTSALINAVVTIALGDSHGSGFVISRDGYILTNAHVVGEGKRVPVLFDNGIRVSGDVVRISKRRDVALVKVPLQNSHVLPIARDKRLKRFDDVYVVGSPRAVKLRSTITKGIISAFRVERNGNRFIQSDAAITGGNSGGPMVDALGNVVGITVAAYKGQNLNLFIPIDDALKALNIELE